MPPAPEIYTRAQEGKSHEGPSRCHGGLDPAIHLSARFSLSLGVVMRTPKLLSAGLLAAALAAPPALSQPSAKPVPLTPAMSRTLDGIFAGFKYHPLVGLSDVHGLAQEEDLYAALLRDPRFARDVGNVVVEFGGASQQAVVDRYVNGADIPYTELRKVWSEVVGLIPTTVYLGQINVYAVVRAVNSALPPNRRIKIWLGEPEIDWPKVTTFQQWHDLVGQRDTHPADLIVQILAKRQKALVIYGNGHLNDAPDNLRSIVENKYPGAFFVVTPYSGYHEAACAVKFEKALGWEVPHLATPVKGTALEGRIRQPGCHATDPAGVTATGKNRLLDDFLETNFALNGNALLYLGPKESLRRSPASPDLYLDRDYRREMDRRYRLMTKTPLDINTVERNPATNQPYEP